MTDPDLTSVPPSVREFVSALTSLGFALSSELGGGRVNRVLEFVGSGCQVRVSADRGQWWIELARLPEIDWYDPDVWEACLDDRPVNREPPSLEGQAEWVLKRWGEVAAASADLAPCLARKRSTRARELLGLPPETGPEPW